MVKNVEIIDGVKIGLRIGNNQLLVNSLVLKNRWYSYKETLELIQWNMKMYFFYLQRNEENDHLDKAKRFVKMAESAWHYQRKYFPKKKSFLDIGINIYDK